MELRACRPSRETLMDFIAAVVAIVAIILVLRMRGRVTVLEQHVTLLNGRIALRDAPPQAAPAPPALPAEPPAVPASPLEIFAKPAEAAPVAPRVDAAATEPASESVPPPLPPAESAQPAEPAEPAKSFEERFGASWVVWIGGLALALGGIFLVQYSIEAGLIGPGVRIFLGGLFAAFLVAAGEWTRRREFSIGLDNIPAAHIPSILTAA